MTPHQKYGKMVIASGEDVPFVYEPSYAQTSKSFNARMDARMAAAKRDQDAFAAEEHSSNGSVNHTPALLLAAPKNQCVAYPEAYTHYGD